MATDPTPDRPNEADPRARARADLARLREAIASQTHWVFLTDDPGAARTLRRSAAGALYVEAVVCLTATGDMFPCAALAVSKRTWPPSAACRVAAAAAGGRAGIPGATEARGGTDLFSISRDTHRLALFLQQLMDGTVSADPPGGG